jgi:hypothetical protein
VRDLKIRVDQLFPRGYHVHHTMGGSGFWFGLARQSNRDDWIATARNWHAIPYQAGAFLVTLIVNTVKNQLSHALNYRNMGKDVNNYYVDLPWCSCLSMIIWPGWAAGWQGAPQPQNCQISPKSTCCEH